MARALQTEYTGATYHLLHVGEWVGCQVFWGGGAVSCWRSAGGVAPGGRKTIHLVGIGLEPSPKRIRKCWEEASEPSQVKMSFRIPKLPPFEGNCMMDVGYVVMRLDDLGGIVSKYMSVFGVSI